MEISLQTMVKKKKKVDRETAVTKVKPNLSRDIIESSILTRLPVKTLIRFMSACKSWHYSFSSDSYFINMHHQIQKNRFINLLLVDYTIENYRVEDPDVVVTHCFSSEQSWSSSFNNKRSNFLPEQSSPPLSFNELDEFRYISVRVVGYCDGIVCVFGSTYSVDNNVEDFIISLWNPSLRISKLVVRNNHLDPRCFHMCVAFGHDNQTNDYNVIRFSNKDFTINHVEVYSLNSDSWRKVNLGKNSQKTLIKGVRVAEFGVYVSGGRGGAYYWFARKGYDTKTILKGRIISFNMEDETFQEIMLPYNITDDKYDGTATIFIYKNSLAVLRMRSDICTPHFKMVCIWVMKEYNNPKSWTKLYSFDTKHRYVSFRGVVGTADLIMLLCGDQRYRGDLYPTYTKLNVVDIDKSGVVNTTECPEIINFFRKAKQVTSFTPSLFSFNKVL